MHNIYEGSWLKRWRIRLFWLTRREQQENADELSRIMAESAERRALEEAEDESYLERARSCSLCFGDRWIADTVADFNRCAEGDERRRFMERMGLRTGAAAGSIHLVACPRCQPDWTP